MLDKNLSKYLFCKLCFDEFLNEWFSYKDKKVLNYIDTFYYTIGTTHDTMANTVYRPFLEFIRSLKEYHVLNDTPYCPMYTDTCFFIDNMKNRNFDLHIFVPDAFDVFICSATPTNDTPFIQVQLRSTYLWMEGVEKAIEDSRQKVLEILDMFGFAKQDLIFKINRCDYCYHTNYIHSPYKFFTPENMARMQCSRYKSSQSHIEYFDNYKYQIDFYSFGLRNSPVYIRMYLKSKEVIECGYKNKKCFFISVWEQTGLISKYDAYVLTHAYIHSNWNYVDSSRLEFYLEYGTDEYYKKSCKELLDADVKDWIAIRSLADTLLPPVHCICNIEFQYLRDFYKSCQLPALDKDEILNVYKCTDIITEYLTEHTFKLVDFDPDKHHGASKYKIKPIPLWSLIQKRKFSNLKNVEQALVREYSSNTNVEMLKNRVYSSVSTLSLCINGDNNDSLIKDIETLIAITNDNDIEAQRIKKVQKKARVSELDSSLKPVRRKLRFLDDETGEIL